MFDWFDLMRQAQKSAVTSLLPHQFHLDGDQTQAAMAAFLPAFAMGVQHALGTKPGEAKVWDLFGGAYQSLWLDAADAFSPASQRNGKQILDQLFGSDDVSRRVAHQAASVTGVNADVMRKMLPVLAGIYAGGFYHWMSGQTALANNALRPAAQEPSDFADSWTRMCAVWLGQKPSTPKTSASPFEAIMESFLLPRSPSTRDRPSPAAALAQNASSPDRPPAWEEMMEKGRDMQRQYLASLQSIFEEADGNEAKKR